MLVWTLLSCLSGDRAEPPPVAAEVQQAPSVEEVAEIEPPDEPVVEPEPETVVLLAVGDVLPHRNVKATARERGWAHVFERVAPAIQGADIAFANLEGPIAPVRGGPVHGEVFNAPADLADGLAAAGFDVVSLANNHAWDQGIPGLEETLDHLDRVGLRRVGAGRSCDEAMAASVVEVRGVRVAFLAVTDLSNQDENGAPDAPCVFMAGDVCIGDCGPDRDAIHYRPDPERILDAVQAADADFVVLSFHWGNEYRTVPLPEYPPLARTLIAGGVDVILGHHAHVLQPIARIEAGGREGVVAYGLGNFVSNMAASWDPARGTVTRGRTRDGGMLRIELVRAGDRLQVGDVRLFPTFTVNNSAQEGRTEPLSVRPVPLDELPAELALQRRADIEAVVGAQWVAPAEDRR